jgi:hypothetical protein
MNETNIYIVKFKNIPNVIYIGNTHLELKKRLRNHKYHTTTLHNYVIKNNIDWDDVYIELYENFKYDDRCEYEKKEEEVIKTFLNDLNYIVINSSKTGGSPTKQILKEVESYLISNLKEIIQENINDCYGYIDIAKEIKLKKIEEKEEKKEIARLNSRIDYYKNRDKKLKQMEEYRKLHKQDEKEMFNCECGHIGLLRNKTIHFRSLRHNTFK